MNRKFHLSAGCEVDLDVLIESRLLVQANSGGGKSTVLRRVLEQTHGKVQHLVIDPEGEFSTLREKFDYVLAARSGGETIADPRSASMLAEKLLTLGASAILDLYELKAHERIRFVRLFLEALIDAPKALWHPALVFIDEAHVYCPEKGHGEAESGGAVIDLCTRGRKRGFAAVLATQRLSKLHKDAAAECNNRLIGRTGLDVDVKRAALDLGMSTPEALKALRALDPKRGQFYAYGPALYNEVSLIQVELPKTRPPSSGNRNYSPPPPTARIKALLPQLADLPAEAEQRAKSIEELRTENQRLKREISSRKVVEKPVEKIVKVEVPAIGPDLQKRFFRTLSEMTEALKKVPSENLSYATTSHQVVPERPKFQRQIPTIVTSVPRERKSGDPKVGPCEGKILLVLMNYPHGCDIRKIALLSGYRISGNFKNALSSLRTKGLLTGANGEFMRLTAEGIATSGVFGGEPLPAGPALVEYWQEHPSFGPVEQAVIKTLLKNRDGLEIAQLSQWSGYQISGNFKNGLSSLRTAGVMVGKNTGTMRLSDEILEAAS